MQATQAYASGSEESDEGFIANSIRVDIDPSIGKQPEQSRPIDMQPRFIAGLGLMLKKEPQQVYKTFKSTEQYKQEISLKRERVSRKTKERVKPIHQKYMSSETFRLVYSRIKGKSLALAQTNYTYFVVGMDHLIHYNEDNYTILREFKLTPNAAQSKHLLFDSRFESGNLMYSYQCVNNELEYHLMMQNDTNTKGYNQWFYFSVEGMKAALTYTFRIVNFKKKHSLFAEGMRPFVFSMKKHALTGNGWSSIIDKIAYEPAGLCISSVDQAALYQLSFEINFEHEDDYVLISMGMPYSYSKLVHYLSQIKPTEGISFSQRILAHTTSNNPVPILTITSQTSNIEKKIIGLVARQHPGETWSSYLMQGFITHILGDSEEAKYLRQRFIFEIVPMLNIDGVIYGNFRCDVNGFDLNRQWKSPHRIMHPQVWAFENHIRAVAQKSEYEMFLDFHGHSKKYNVFCYTCQEDFHSCRVLPLMISKLSEIFNFPDCTYGIDRSKTNTARAFIFNTIKKVNVLTIQCSFYGTNMSKILKGDVKSAQVFNPLDMYNLAADIIKSINIYENGAGTFSKESVEQEVVTRAKQFADYDRQNQNDSGSESDPYSDQLDEEEYKKVLTTRVLTAIEGDHQARTRYLSNQSTQIEGKNAKKNKSIKQVFNYSKRLIVSNSRKGRELAMTEQKKKKKPEQISPRKREIQNTAKKQIVLQSSKNRITFDSVGRPINPFVESTDSEPRLMFRTRNAIFVNKPNIKTSFKEFNFIESQERSVNHNRVQSQWTQAKYTDIVRTKNRSPPQMLKSCQKSKVTKYTESIAKRIQQTMYPLLQQRSVYQSPQTSNQSRMQDPAWMTEVGHSRHDQKESCLNRDTITESNSIFQLQRRKNINMVHLERVHRKAELDKYQRSQAMSHMKRNFVRYERPEGNTWIQQ